MPGALALSDMLQQTCSLQSCCVLRVTGCLWTPSGQGGYSRGDSATQPGSAGLAQHLGEHLSGGDSSYSHVPPRAEELFLSGLGRMKLHVAEEPVPVSTLVWRNCSQSSCQ